MGPGFHTTARAQMCTFEGSGFQKHQQNSTKGPQERERRMKIVARGGKKEERNFGRSGGGLSGGGLSSGGGFTAGGGSSVRGFGFSSGFSGRKQKQNKNKMMREMSKDKKKKRKVKRQTKEKTRKRERRNRSNTICSTSANLDFGPFRLRPAGHKPLPKPSQKKKPKTPQNPPNPPK